MKDDSRKHRTLLDTSFGVSLRARAKTSRVAAVHLFCLECVGGVRKDVRDCTATDCALYPWRPYRTKEPA